MGLKPGLVASSDLSRARQTAELLAAETGYSGKLLVEEGLREQDLGDWNGLTRPEIEESWPGALAEREQGHLLDVAGGESGHRFAERSLAALGRVAGACCREGVKDAIAVSHGGVLVVLEQALGLFELGLRRHNLSGWLLELSGDAAAPDMAAVGHVELLGTGVEIVSRPL